MTVVVGTSGWSYDHWEPELYPHGLPARERLPQYAAAFPTAELNSSSFYRWPSPAQFTSSTSGCTAPTGTICTRARTVTPTSRGGLLAAG